MYMYIAEPSSSCCSVIVVHLHTYHVFSDATSFTYTYKVYVTQTLPVESNHPVGHKDECHLMSKPTTIHVRIKQC